MNFNDPTTWIDYDKDQQVSYRANILKSLIPSDVRTILDVGCGSGVVTNKLAADYDVNAMDISEAALERVECPKLCASITSIPFGDKSFDLVNCNEVLEHLNDEDLDRGASELLRTANRYILISVPHREQLNRYHCRCAKCGSVSHPYGHLQSFTEERLGSLFSKCFHLKRRLIYGPPHRDMPLLLLNYRQQVLNQWFSPQKGYLCPQCQSAIFESAQNLQTKLINGLNRLLTKPRPYWLIALFVRKG